MHQPHFTAARCGLPLKRGAATPSLQLGLQFGLATALSLAASLVAAEPPAPAKPAVKAAPANLPPATAPLAPGKQPPAVDAKNEPLVVRIGHAAPLTGIIGFLGRDEENGVRLAIETLNARKLHIGGRPVRWELVAADDGGVPTKAVAVAKEFCAAQLAGVIGHLQSGTTLPAARIYNECNLPNITPAAGSPGISQAGYELTFRVIADDRAQMQKLVTDAVTRQGVKRILAIDNGSAFGQTLIEWVKDAADEEDIEVVDTVKLPPAIPGSEDRDFSAVFKALVLKKADAMFYPGLDARAAQLVQQWAAAAKVVPSLASVRLLGGEAMCSDRLPELAGPQPLLKNVSCVLAGVPLDELHNAAQWKQMYARQFPKVAPVFSPYAYDATMVLAQAMLDADSTRAEAYVPYLRRMEYQGYTGKISFTPLGDLESGAVGVYRFVNGERKLVPESVAAAGAGAATTPIASPANPAAASVPAPAQSTSTSTSSGAKPATESAVKSAEKPRK